MLNEQAIAFEIGLLGPGRARTFLQSLMARFQGNTTVAANTEPPIHNPTATEAEANNAAAIEEWNRPESESTHQKAVNYILAHNGCLSGEVKKAMQSQGVTDNEWAYTLKKLGNDPRLRKEGDRVSLRWFKT